MLITQPNLEALRTGFRTDFKGGMSRVKPSYKAFTTEVPSATKITTYGFLKNWPIFRRWLGERRINSLEELAYLLKNEKFEVSIGIPSDDIEDDNLGLFPSMFAGWGDEAGSLKDRLAYEALRMGHLRPCFDGQNYFDTDHPGGTVDAQGVVTQGVFSNMSGAGAVQPYYLLDTRKPLKPILLQNREEANFSMITDPESDHVFKTGEYLAGGKARAAAGYTYPHLAHRSTAALTEENYVAACAQGAALVDEQGEPLGVKFDTIVVGNSNKAAARTLFKAQNKAGGASNIYFEDVTILEADRLL